jgi:hypothetical protein
MRVAENGIGSILTTTQNIIESIEKNIRSWVKHTEKQTLQNAETLAFVINTG